MRKGIRLYPFHGQMMSLPEISRYYNKKGIELNYSMFMAEVKKISDKEGRENITEEQIFNAVKTILYKKSLGAALPDFKENCIKEFGQEFWDGLLERKASIIQAKKERIKREKEFRESVKIDLNQNPRTKAENKTRKIEEREVKNGGAR